MCLQPCRMPGLDYTLISRTCWFMGDEGDPRVWLLLQQAAAEGRQRTNRQHQSFQEGPIYHLALGKELQYFPDYVCTQTSVVGKLCNPEQGGVGAREEGLEGGPTLHPAALGPRRRSCSPRGTALWPRMGSVTTSSPFCRRSPCTTASEHRGSPRMAQGLLTASSLSTQAKMHIFVTQAI